MELHDVRSRFLGFWKERGHTVIPSASLVPENDPTTLFTGSGMQPLIPYLLGAPHPEGKRVVNSQKSFRAEDIDEVGDNRHTTFFEMLGNWSFGDYWKQEQLPRVFEFLTEQIGIDPKNLYVTVFAGDRTTGIPADEESVGIWKKNFEKKGIDAKYVVLGSEADASEAGMQGGRIFAYDVKKNWWSRAGVPSKMPAGEPGGPDSEMFYDFGDTDERGLPRHEKKFGKECHPNCDCGRFMEIGNSVFMEYKKNEDGTFEKLKQRNVDFGGGLERIVAATNNDPDVFAIDVFKKMREALRLEGGLEGEALRELRIILDHIRASVFLIADGVMPSNKGQGYVLRRLLRRAVLYARNIPLKEDYKKAISGLVPVVADVYKDHYEDLGFRANDIRSQIEAEFEKFDAVMEAGLKEFSKITKDGAITGRDAFNLLQSFGFPWEVTQELAEKRGINVNKEEFQSEFKKHQDLSRTASAGVFKGGLADTAEKTVKLHTAHHLLLKALQMVLGPHVKQRGSNITSERLRIDFLHDAKMTEEQKKEVERIVNEKIGEDLPVVRSELAREVAEELGAEHEFGQKYPERVSIYSVGPKGATVENPQFEKAFSIEFCGGPHVAHTGEIGRFKIAKEEAVAAGIRRIRGVVE